MEPFTPFLVDKYDPLKAGSIDGTDEVPHDKAIWRAMHVKYRPSKSLSGHRDCTIFIGRLNPHTTEQTIQRAFQEYGDVKRVKLVRDLVTGYSKCYAFLEFEDDYQAKSAVRSANKMVIDDHEVLVDSEKERTLKGWIPRRLGGGFGGKRESGQLRFGGRDRPFSKPIFRKERQSDTGMRQDRRIDHSDSSRHPERSQPDRQRSHRRSRSRSRERSSYRSRSKNRYR